MNTKTFFMDKLAVAHGKCLPGRYKDYIEHPCQDVCPNKAIVLKPLGIDYDLCDDCGICASVCPAGALNIKESFLKDLFRQTLTDGGMELKIRCSRVGGPCAAVACLGALDYAFFVDLCTSGAKNLRLFSGNCESCRIAAGGEVTRSNVNAANDLLSIYDRDERVTMIESAYRQELESGARRAMFRGMGRTISRFMPDLYETCLDSDAGTEPARRQRSIKMMERLEEGRRGTATDVPIPFMGKEIDAARCDVCGGVPMCVSLCPTDALEFSAERGGAAITYAASICIGCELCKSACHKAAVSSFPLLSGQIEELWATKTLAGFDARECDGCGRVTVAARGGLCGDCQQRERKLGWEIA
jgi:ferredoxin